MRLQAPVALDWNDTGLRQVGRLIGPIILGTAASQAGGLVIRALASRLPEGSITYLNYSQRLAALPVGVFGTALTTVLYPTLARLYSEDKSEFSRTFRRSIGIVFFILRANGGGTDDPGCARCGWPLSVVFLRRRPLTLLPLRWCTQPSGYPSRVSRTLRRRLSTPRARHAHSGVRERAPWALTSGSA